MDVVASPTTDTAPASNQRPEPVEKRAGLVPSHGIAVEDDNEQPSELSKPPLLKHVSSPNYNSPLRHHRRMPSTPKHVKESLNARSQYVTSEDDGSAEHRLNQYIIKQEIGRGAFGAVHLAVDQYGHEYAVKEFSKARLRKRARSHILRSPLQQRKQGALGGFNIPLHRVLSEGQDAENSSSIDLIKEELAIMKKLDHPNLVSLIEVLDDPSEDSLYMVMEMCKKGVVMKVGLDQRADPYPEETCRCWFQDLILGIEYLHAQGVVHRDIKPDNCLINSDDVLKVVDFGVSEMFEKHSEMMTAKSAGSPAFLPPELCIARHGDVSGKAADIWSMGATLYCLKYGRIPFEKSQIFELYDSIKSDKPEFPAESDQDFVDMMIQIFEKDPSKRITMTDLRVHPWVTKRGTDPLLSEADNTSDLVEPPTEAEMNAAITGNMRNLMTVVKAVNKFKSLTAHKRPPVMDSILGDASESHFSQPPHRIKRKELPLPYLARKAHSDEAFDRDPSEGLLVAEGLHRDIVPKDMDNPATSSDKLGTTLDVPTRSAKADSDQPGPDFDSDPEEAAINQIPNEHDGPVDPEGLPPFRSRKKFPHTTDDIGHKGQAHDPLEDHLYLFVGPSTFAGTSTVHDRRGSFMPDEDDVPIVSESPGAADVDIYETAYRDEVERILAKAKQEDKEPNVYLNRRVDEKLMAISGRAGRFMAGAEEAAKSFDYHTQFSVRRAKVSEVSRALRQAAREEYEKRRQEKRDAIALQKSATDRTGEASAAGPASVGLQTQAAPDGLQSPSATSPLSGRRAAALDKARDKGKRIFDLVKNAKSG